MKKVVIRSAGEKDFTHALQLIKELAAYERAPGEVAITLEDFSRDGSGIRPLFKILVAETDGEIVGMALYYYAYSTWKGKMIYLDDLVVNEKWRRLGIGKMLFDELIREAKEENVRQVRWHVLEWNEPAIRFYQKIGASLDPEWITGKLSADQITSYKPDNRP